MIVPGAAADRLLRVARREAPRPGGRRPALRADTQDGLNIPTGPQPGTPPPRRAPAASLAAQEGGAGGVGTLLVMVVGAMMAVPWKDPTFARRLHPRLRRRAHVVAARHGLALLMRDVDRGAVDGEAAGARGAPRPAHGRHRPSRGMACPRPPPPSLRVHALRGGCGARRRHRDAASCAPPGRASRRSRWCGTAPRSRSASPVVGLLGRAARRGHSSPRRRGGAPPSRWAATVYNILVFEAARAGLEAAPARTAAPARAPPLPPPRPSRLRHRVQSERARVALR